MVSNWTATSKHRFQAGYAIISRVSPPKIHPYTFEKWRVGDRYMIHNKAKPSFPVLVKKEESWTTLGWNVGKETRKSPSDGLV
jgi:hypothetical protein